MQLGMTLPNRQWDSYTSDELKALVDLDPDVIVWLLYGGNIDQVHAGQLYSFLMARPRRILYRPFATDIPKRAPAAWAQTCRQWMGWIGHPGELIPANEMNLPVEGGSEDWNAHIAWLRAFEQEWRQDDTTTPLHLPALSPSGNYTDGLRAYYQARLTLIYDRYDVHAYGPYAAATIGKVADILDDVLDCTEFNGIDPALLARSQPRCQSLTWFLLGGTKDQAPYDIMQNAAYYAGFKEATHMATVGQGFTKCIPLIGEFVEDEIYHANQTPNQTSLAIAAEGYATYRPDTNETFAHHNDGRVWCDDGNHRAGEMRLLRDSFTVGH